MTTGRPLTIVFLIDALGWEVASHFRFGSLFPRRAPLGTVLGYSSTAIPSLLTGTRPVEHGSFAMFRAAGADGTFSFLRGIPRLPHALDWRARRWLRRLLDRRGSVRAYYDLYEIPVHLLHHFDVGMKGNPFEPGQAPRESVFDLMRARGVRWRLWDYRSAEEANLRDAVQAVSGDVDVLFVYTAELDALMHRVGTQDPAVGARLARYDVFLHSLVDAARACGRPCTLTVLSDHGMTPVHTVVDPWGAVEARGIKLGRDYVAFFDSTMVRVWGDDRVDAAFADAFGSLGRKLDDSELDRLGCKFPGAVYGRSIFLANPGVLVVPSFMGSRRIAAMHGYHPDDAHSLGCFMTTVENAELPGSILGFKDFFGRVLDGAR